MKIFSMVFTILFFLSFASIASAESEHTITNRIEETALVAFFVDENRAWIIEYDQCLKVKASDFNRLNLMLLNEDQMANLGRKHNGIYEGLAFCNNQQTCLPNNYVALQEESWWPFSSPHYFMEIELPNRNCSDLDHKARILSVYNFPMK